MTNILFLHGWGGDEKSFAAVLPFFTSKYKCVCVRMPRENYPVACGATPSRVKGNIWTLDDFADFVIAELDKLDIKKTHIIAHSFGARVAVLLVNRCPERFGKLILTGPAGIRARLGLWRRTKIKLHKMKIIKSKGSADYRVLSPEGKKTFQNIVNRDLSAEISRISHPTLLIWGTRDSAIKKSAIKRWTKLAPCAKLVIYRGCGHFCFLDAPARFIVDAEEFLNA